MIRLLDLSFKFEIFVKNLEKSMQIFPDSDRLYIELTLTQYFQKDY